MSASNCVGVLRPNLAVEPLILSASRASAKKNSRLQPGLGRLMDVLEWSRCRLKIIRLTDFRQPIPTCPHEFSGVHDVCEPNNKQALCSTWCKKVVVSKTFDHVRIYLAHLSIR